MVSEPTAAAVEAYPHVFSPLSIGKVRLRNRIFVPAHSTHFGSSEHHYPTPRHVAYHLERARGGVALIISEAIRFFPPTWRKGRMGVFSEEDIGAFAELADAVHGEGAALFAQMNEPGRHMRLDRMAPVSSAGDPWMVGGPTPHAMNLEEIRVLVNAYGVGARRIHRAGFDGLELHLGHGHLLNQFLSPSTNQRTDEFGGSEENRLRVPRACLEAVFKAVDCPVGIRISGDEFLDDGLHLDDTLRIVGGLLEEFPIAFVHVSQSFYSGEYSLTTQVADMTFGPGPFLHLARAFKEQFPETLVFAVCRIDDIRMAEEVLSTGTADMAGMARTHISHPHLVRKAALGRFEETRHCIACNQGCIGRGEFGWPISCVVNPEVGLEGSFEALRDAGVDEQHKVLVVGGGPSGLEAAVTARRRGHDVTLVEAADQLGGQIRYASALRNRERLAMLVEELERDAHREGVIIEVGKRMSAQEVALGEWDAVVVATGSRPRLPSYDGMKRIFSVWEALERPEELGGNAVIVDHDTNWSGAGLAEHLAAQGRAVTIITPTGGIGTGITVYNRAALYRRLRELRVTGVPLTDLVRGDGAGNVAVRNTMSGSETALAGVSAVVYTGPQGADDTVFTELQKLGGRPELFLIGDAYAARTLLEATYEGHLTGYAIGVKDRSALVRLVGFREGIRPAVPTQQ